MSKSKSYKCDCGRLAEVEVNGEFVCWEKYLISDPTIWKSKYPRDPKARHKSMDVSVRDKK